MEKKEKQEKQEKIKEQFNLVAKEYDKNRKKFIPCFEDFYEKSTDFVASTIGYPAAILDLGSGTGLLSAFYFKRFPAAQFFLVDIARDMTDIARKRFSFADNVKFLSVDYANDFDNLLKERAGFDLIISALSIHHLEDEKKKELFRNIYFALTDRGTFVNYDQFCAESKVINADFSRYWEEGLFGGGLSKDDLSKWRERQKLDRECSVEREVEMIRSSGFENAECIYLAQKFGVIIGKK